MNLLYAQAGGTGQCRRSDCFGAHEPHLRIGMVLAARYGILGILA